MIFDLHNDAITKLNTAQFIKYLKAHKDCKINFTVFTTEQKDAMQTIEHSVKVLHDNLKNPVWSVEDLGFLNSYSFDCLEKIIELKPFTCSLTWNYTNALAGGALSDSGLTTLGKQVIKNLESKNIFVDVAHLCERSFFDAADITSLSLLNTHSCFYDLCEHPRNLSNKQLKLIVQSGGLVGLALVPYFLSNKQAATINDVINHIDYFVQSFGVNNLCIGTDFYGTDTFPKNLNSYNDFKNLRIELSGLGYKPIDIDKIFFSNAFNFFSKHNTKN